MDEQMNAQQEGREGGDWYRERERDRSLRRKRFGLEVGGNGAGLQGDSASWARAEFSSGLAAAEELLFGQRVI